MNFVQLLVILSLLVSASGYVAYISDTLKGHTQPNRMSWFLWMLSPAVAAGAALSAGSDIWPTLIVLSSALFPLSILIASFFNKKGYWKLTKFDWGCGALSIIALIIWLLLDSPQIAILFAIAADTLAAAPTIRKVWVAPNSETSVAYLTETISALLILPAIPVWNIENAAFQIYILVVNLLVFLLIYRKRWQGKADESIDPKPNN